MDIICFEFKWAFITLKRIYVVKKSSYLRSIKNFLCKMVMNLNLRRGVCSLFWSLQQGKNFPKTVNNKPITVIHVRKSNWNFVQLQCITRSNNVNGKALQRCRQHWAIIKINQIRPWNLAWKNMPKKDWRWNVAKITNTIHHNFISWGENCHLCAISKP